MSNYTYAERDSEFSQEEKVEYYEDWVRFGDKAQCEPIEESSSSQLRNYRFVSPWLPEL